MRFSTVFVVLSAAFATTSASLLETRQSGYASCALPCLTTITSASCAANDTKCLCQDKDFVNKTTLCFQTNCTGDDLTKSVAAAVEMCRAVGVTLSSGPTSTPAPGSSTSSKPSSSKTSSTPAPSSTSKSSASSNGVNVLFALSAFGLIGYAL